MTDWILISMYTPDTPYEEIIKKLRKSMDNVGRKFTYKFYKIENRGSWVKNCQQSSECILDALLVNKCGVLYVDADAILMEYPMLFDNFNHDIAYHTVIYPEKHQACTGTLFVSYSLKTLSLMHEWVKLNRSNDQWDDDNLQSLVGVDNWGIDVYDLPESYCRIDQNRIQTGNECVIRHTQASRKYKKVING